MRSRFLPSWLWNLGLPLVLLGCTIGPVHQVPTVAAGDGWQHSADTSAPMVDAWWHSLGDPELNRLIEIAETKNLDVRQALLRISEARSVINAVASGKYPQVSADGSVTRRRQSLNGPIPVTSIPGVQRDQTIYDTGFDAAWELDLFGRVRRSVESAEAQAQLQEASALDLRNSLAAEIARIYLSIRGAQRELAAREAALSNIRGMTEMVRRRVELGDHPQAELDRSTAQLDSATTMVPGITARIEASRIALALLLGGRPEELPALAATPSLPRNLTPIPVGERADILRRRPDIRVAERRLAAATAEVGLAKAEWFPRLAISASAGFQALQSADLFKSSSQALSLTPLISWRIFDGGRVRAQIGAAESRQQSAALDYEKAVLVALADAERSLSGYQLSLEAWRSQTSAFEAIARSHRHAKERYGQGDISRYQLLDSERSLHEAEESVSKAYTTAATNLVGLHKALGSGWRISSAFSADGEKAPGIDQDQRN
jgi:NodT family efflux transporter outer membrane factor (OMF) lipoprotein